MSTTIRGLFRPALNLSATVLVTALMSVGGAANAQPPALIEAPDANGVVPSVTVDPLVSIADVAPVADVKDAPKDALGSSVSERRAPMAARVMNVAAAQAGDRYQYGASGPNAFDCSGLTSFVYRVAAGKSLPHSSSAQAGVTQRISRAAARPGDLVFFHSGSGIYHVAIFAGGNSIIHASKPGVPVGRAQIWTSAVSFGRVR
jgi:cell wall-associated NlpC family hydrolase